MDSEPTRATSGIWASCSGSRPRRARMARRSDATEFEQGTRMAYYSVISLMQD